jgi:hypothetical protein
MCLRSRVAHPLPCTEESSASWRSCSSRKGGVGTRGPRRSRVVLSRSERPADPRYCFGLQASSNQRVYFRVTDSAGRTVVIGSACRCTSFQVPSSDRKMLVTRRATGVISLPPRPSLRTARSPGCTRAPGSRTSPDSRRRSPCCRGSSMRPARRPLQSHSIRPSVPGKVAEAGGAPSAITPAAATPITIAHRLPVSSFPSVG